MQVLSNGKFLVAIDTGVDTTLLQMTSEYALDTASFGTGTGKIALTGFTNPQNMMIGIAGDILVVGDNGAGVSMLQKVTASGSATSWTAAMNVEIGNVILEQASGRLVFAGKNGSSGVLVGYNPIDGTIDPYFGSLGTYSTGVNSQIIGAVVTSTDKIVYVYRDGSGNAIVKRVVPNGSALDASFSFGTPIASVSADNQIKLQLDVNGKIVVVARNSTGDFIMQRYLANGGNDVGPVTIQDLRIKN